MSDTKFEVPSWDEIYEMLVELGLDIQRAGYDPEVIVGVSRGGWPPARVMSDLLQNQNLANMKVVFYKDLGVRGRTPKITQPVSSVVRGKRVLVVDDVSDSGHSLRMVVKHLREKGASEIRVCTLYLKPNSIFVPDYYEKKTSKWIVFPWERSEAIRQVSRSLSKKETRSLIKAFRNSGINSRLLRQLLTVSQYDRKS